MRGAASQSGMTGLLTIPRWCAAALGILVFIVASGIGTSASSTESAIKAIRDAVTAVPHSGKASQSVAPPTHSRLASRGHGALPAPPVLLRTGTPAGDGQRTWVAPAPRAARIVANYDATGPPRARLT